VEEHPAGMNAGEWHMPSHLEYRLTVQSDAVVVGELYDEGAAETFSQSDALNLNHLDAIAGYLPLFDNSRQQSRKTLETFGGLLYDTLFAKSVAGHFEQLAWRKLATHPDRYHLSLSLTFHDGLRADIAALPWEFLYHRQGDAFLATDRRVAFSHRRFGWPLKPTEPIAEALRIVLVRLQPKGLEPVALTRITNYLTELARKQARLQPPMVLEDPEPLAIEETLERVRPHILHLVLHGRFEEQGTRFALAGAAGQVVRWYGDKSLAEMFSANPPRLVLLQACEGGRLSDARSFANGAAWLVRQNVPAVAAMRYPITNEAGWTFAEKLYERLLMGDDLDAAAQLARRALAHGEAQDSHAARDFGAPVLWMRPEARRWLSREEEGLEMHTTVTILTPDHGQFEAEAPLDLPVGLLLHEFLSQWQPPPSTTPTPRHYFFQRDDPARTRLEAATTLREAQINNRARLVLAVETLTRDAPIGLTIEDAQGRRYTTAVRLGTKVGELAEAFLRQFAGQGEPVVEAVGGPPGVAPRPLRLAASLFDEGVGEETRLRIFRQAPSAQR
jgi:hypothetical protein